MKRVLVTANLIDAQLAADTLRSLGIPARILNQHAAGALGELPFMQAQPEVWIDDDAQDARAREVLALCLAQSPDAERRCPRCGENNPGHFLSCWHCGGALAA
jgi:hypothetical protein